MRCGESHAPKRKIMLVNLQHLSSVYSTFSLLETQKGDLGVVTERKDRNHAHSADKNAGPTLTGKNSRNDDGCVKHCDPGGNQPTALAVANVRHWR